MTRRLVLSYVTITLLVLLVLEIPLALVFARSERRNLIAELKHDALALSSLAVDTLDGRANADLYALARGYQHRTDARVVITDRTGTLVADSTAPDPAARSFATRPEIAQALRGRETTGTRHSRTLDTDLLYVAVPVASGGRVAGAVRLTFTPVVVDRVVRRIWVVLALVGLAVLAAVAAISVLLARSVSLPIRRLESAAARIAGGDLSARADVRSGPPEVCALAEAFNLMAGRLELLVRSNEEFVADASHQLRTPLHALRLRLENAEAAAGQRAKADLAGALAEVERLARLVDGLLALARADRTAPPTADIDLTDILEGRREAWEPVAGERGVSIATDTNDGARRAVATPGHLDQILDNLISNALAASPAGSTIEVWTSDVDGRVEVHVSDRGPGMSAQERERATERFWRPSDGGRGGTGLGLTIARRLAEVDGGALDLREQAGGGLDAVVVLRRSASGT